LILFCFVWLLQKPWLFLYFYLGADVVTVLDAAVFDVGLVVIGAALSVDELAPGVGVLPGAGAGAGCFAAGAGVVFFETVAGVTVVFFAAGANWIVVTFFLDPAANKALFN